MVSKIINLQIKNKKHIWRKTNGETKRKRERERERERERMYFKR
jgi:hypothetical protein